MTDDCERGSEEEKGRKQQNHVKNGNETMTIGDQERRSMTRIPRKGRYRSIGHDVVQFHWKCIEKIAWEEDNHRIQSIVGTHSKIA